ncbi:MAG: carbohydrate-binding protein [Gammaproteobacteria bacterium]|nr:carbohydrate-binding protein [Gammaproteobacteria bacterium]
MDTTRSCGTGKAQRRVSICLLSLTMAQAPTLAATLAGIEPLEPHPGVVPIDGTLSAVTGPSTGSVVRLLEAEEAVHNGSIEVAANHEGYTGTGFVDFLEEGNIEWTVDTPMRGLYQLEFRYALGVDQSRPMDILANSVPVSSDVSFPFTQRWENWQTVQFFVKLESGTNVIRLTTDGASGPNVDHLLVSLTPPDANKFLSLPIHSSDTVFRGSESHASAYYKVIDPLDRKTTLADWKTENGFDGSENANADSHAVYLNAADLNFGRSMFVKQSGDRIASFVQNYPSVADAIAGTNLIATVAMEYGYPLNKDSGLEMTDKPRFTTFYVFNAAGTRVTSADLDGRGEKFVPGLCNVCHGGKPKSGGFHGSVATYQDRGDTGAKWIPWDLDTYEFHPSLTRVMQESTFKAMNATILQTNPTSTTRTLVKGWYGGEGMPEPAFNGAFVPSGWKNAGADGDKSALYLNVVAPSCRACHSQRGTYNNSGHVVFQGEALEQSLEFATFSAFKGYKDEIESLVYDQGIMPLALRTYERFWRSDQPKILDEQLFGGTAHKNPPADVLSSEAKYDFGDLRRPGRPVLRIAGLRFSNSFGYSFADVKDSGRVRLNARPSYFGETFSWSIQSAPGAIPTINSADKSLATFDLDPSASSDIKSEGSSSPYHVRLLVRNKHAGDPAESVTGQLWSNSDLEPLNFVEDIYPLLTTGFPSTRSSTPLSCIQCHSNGNVVSRADGIFVLRDFQLPEGENEAIWKDYAFSHFMTRVNCDDPAASLVLLKPAGFHHWNGTVNGFANLGDSGDANHRAEILRWIMEGAPYDSAGSRMGCQASRLNLLPGDIGLLPKPLSPVPNRDLLSR